MSCLYELFTAVNDTAKPQVHPTDNSVKVLAQKAENMLVAGMLQLNMITAASHVGHAAALAPG